MESVVTKVFSEVDTNKTNIKRQRRQMNRDERKEKNDLI